MPSTVHGLQQAIAGSANIPRNPEEASNSLISVISAFASPFIQRALISSGYVSPGFDPKKSAIQALRDTRIQRELLRVMYSGTDAPGIANIANSILYLAGVDPASISTQEKINFISKNLSSFAPFILAFVGEEKYDEIFGRVGSHMLATRGILQAFQDYGMDGPSAANLATSLMMAIKANPNLSQGFTTQEIAQILNASVKAGLISPTIDGNHFIRQVINILPMLAAIKDTARLQGKDITPEELTKTLPTLLSQYSGIPPTEAANRIRKENYIRSLAPHGLFQAAVQATGAQIPIAPEIYTKDDITLRQQAADSPVGNMVGATIRAVQAYGARGKLGQLYKNIMSGNLPTITPMQWLDIASQSGIRPQAAISLLRQTARNKAFITPEIANTIRSAQFEYDIAPLIARIEMTYPDPELRAGAIAQLAEKLGYQPVGMIDPGQYMLMLHSNIINEKTKEVLQAAQQQATLETQTAHMGQMTPTRRISEIIQSPTLTEEGKFDFKSNLLRGLNAIHETQMPMTQAQQADITRQTFLPKAGPYGNAIEQDIKNDIWNVVKPNKPLPKIDLPKFDMPNFNMPKFNMPKL